MTTGVKGAATGLRGLALILSTRLVALPLAPAALLCRFKLSQVRSDPAVFPYLLLPALDDWQACTVNPSSTAAGHPCLTKIAKDPLVETLTTHRHMLNVFIAGSRDEAAWCDVSASPAPVCAGVVAGFSNAWGPWFADGDASWSEEGPEANWVFLTWDMFNPAARNSARFWDGGGATFAHEAGHYLVSSTWFMV